MTCSSFIHVQYRLTIQARQTNGHNIEKPKGKLIFVLLKYVIWFVL